MSDYCTEANEYIHEVIETLKTINVKTLSDVINVLEMVLEEEKTVYVFGNGGSAATASHMQNDFNKGVSEFTNKKFRFCCLSDNIATVTAIANDCSYDEIFRRQLEGRLSSGDVVVAISGSGNSKNIIKAVEYAREKGNTVIGITGYDGGKLKQMADYSLHADIINMQIAEDVHILFNHLMMSVLCQKYCGGKR